MAANSEVTRKVLAYYRTKAGQLVHYADAASDLGMEKQNVNASLARMNVRHPEAGIRREGLAGHYVWRQSQTVAPPVQEPETRYFEKVGTTRSGEIVVRDENGRLFRLADEI